MRTLAESLNRLNGPIFNKIHLKIVIITIYQLKFFLGQIEVQYKIPINETHDNKYISGHPYLTSMIFIGTCTGIMRLT